MQIIGYWIYQKGYNNEKYLVLVSFERDIEIYSRPSGIKKIYTYMLKSRFVEKHFLIVYSE